MNEVNTAYLSLGSNLGDRAANLLRAVSALCGAGLRLAAISSIYETEPVDYHDQPDFLNLAVAVEARRIDPFALLKLCLEIESRLGRRRLIPKGPRAIDIDLLLVDELMLEGERGGVALTLPHPRLHLRRFVLTPLAEIAPELLHPLLGKTIEQILKDLDNSASARIFTG